MWFDIITIFPEMFAALDYGITGRAQKNGLIKVNCLDLRDYSDNSYRRVDDRPYGGGPGMVLMFEPLRKAIARAKAAAEHPVKVISFTPQGRLLKQADIEALVSQDSVKHFIFIAGRYEGIDERVVENEIDEEWSIGDYVLSGGELAVMVLIDAITRLLPDALGDAESAKQDSFSNGLLDCPHYTRPEISDNKAVPEVLLSGDHKAIARWRLKQSLGRTWLRRPDLLSQRELAKDEKTLLDEFIAEQECKTE